MTNQDQIPLAAGEYTDYNIQDFDKWLAELGKHMSPDRIHEVSASQTTTEMGDVHGDREVVIYTDTNSYKIYANSEELGVGYLGCISSARKPRAGESQTRGNDLADGPLTKETWYNIIGDILSYELVKIHRPKRDKYVGEEVKHYTLYEAQDVSDLVVDVGNDESV